MQKQAVVVGGGAREHALVHGLVQSGAMVYAAPGNGGIGQEAELVDANTPDELATLFGRDRPLILIGPEAPLAAGWSDRLRQRGFPVVGPSQAAARLESSKRVAKAVMQRYQIPTASARVAHGSAELGEWIAAEPRWPQVLKQSRLASGKGVVVAGDAEEAKAVLKGWEADSSIWEDGVLFEDFLVGWEISIQVVTNGHTYQWLPASRDYKRLTPDPKSPNTGGMGAVAPVPLDAALVRLINRQVFDPIMRYLAEERLLYRGILYAGLMITDQGPWVLEFNVRLGDPETQVIVPLLELDWFEFWNRLAHGDLVPIPAPQGAAVGVVMAAQGYPGAPQTGQTIRIPAGDPHTLIFHAGTRQSDQGFQSHGGRVLTVVGRAATVTEAARVAYQRVQTIDFPASWHRPDIGLS